MTDVCLIWENEFPAKRTPHPNGQMTIVDDSPRAGGNYQIGHWEAAEAQALNAAAKARLTTWIVDQNAQGVGLPEITHQIVEDAKRKSALPVYERTRRLLRWVADQVPTMGMSISLAEDEPRAMAWSESTDLRELEYMLLYLRDQHWISLNQLVADRGLDYQVEVTVEGHRQVESQETNTLSFQSFVAMWFDDSTKDAYEKGILPGVEDAGYKPYRVDKDEHIDKIDDKIISEIRRSRFLVADFTHDRKGARGGVYFEAGFALGLGIPVIFCCREDQIDDVHFDTRQYNHILWTTPEELKTKLADRIGARLGPGPGTLVNS